MTIPPMPNCTADQIQFGRLGRRVIEANFEGGDISSDRGRMLLRCVDERLGLTRAVAAALNDPRDPDRITHSLEAIVAQRIYALCAGYEDLNDHDLLRRDPHADGGEPKRGLGQFPHEVPT